MFSSNRFDSMHAVCTDLLFVVCNGLLSAEFSTVNTGLGRPMIWKLLACEHALSSCQSSFSFNSDFFYIHNH